MVWKVVTPTTTTTTTRRTTLSLPWPVGYAAGKKILPVSFWTMFMKFVFFSCVMAFPPPLAQGGGGRKLRFSSSPHSPVDRGLELGPSRIRKELLMLLPFSLYGELIYDTAPINQRRREFCLDFTVQYTVRSERKRIGAFCVRYTQLRRSAPAVNWTVRSDGRGERKGDSWPLEAYIW